jgi:hypothetical protein
MATGQAGQQNFCFVNPALFWRPRGAGLLNPAIPVQNPYVFGEFFQKFAEMSIVQVTVPKLISNFGEISRPKQNGWSQPTKTYFAFWRNFASKTNAGPSPQNQICIWRNFTPKKHAGHSPKLISQFGETWSQKQKSGHSPKTDSAFWRNSESKTKTRSQSQN